MPADVLLNHETDRSEVGLYVAWCHLFFGNDLAANEVGPDVAALAGVHLNLVLQVLNDDTYGFAASDQVRLLAEVGLLFVELKAPAKAMACLAAGRRVERAKQVEDPIVRERLDQLGLSINRDEV